MISTTRTITPPVVFSNLFWNPVSFSETPFAGNNAVEMETTATFDPSSDEFVIRSPTSVSQKYWITNGAIDAHWAVVFGQLIIRNQRHGVHGFLVPIRSHQVYIIA